MSGVDNRIVTMQFNNRQFEGAAKQSMSTLAKLKSELSFGSVVGGTIRGLDTIAGALSKIGLKTPFAPMISAANKGLGVLGGVLDKVGMRNPFEKSIQGAGELQQATQEVAGPSGLGALEGGVTAVSNKFLLMSTIAVTAMNKITTSVMDSVTAQAKALLGINAMKDGYSDYNAKLTSVQTVMNATGKSMEYVGERFDKLDKYADDTIYDMNDMTSAIAKFSNAGVDLDKSVVAIEGIGNATAYAGQGSSEAALAYRNFSDAISKGYLGGGDFLSLKNSNVITKQFKEEMIKAGIAAGTLKKNANGTYDTLGKGAKKAGIEAAELWNVLGDTQWADQEVVMKTLNEYGDASTKMGKKAKAAAQDVRDFPMLLDTLKASAGTGWTESFETMFGNVEESKVLWTGVADAIGGVLGDLSKARNDMLAGWKKDGGRAAVIDGFKNGWKALGMVLKPIKEAFTEMFPQSAAKGLVSASKGFRDFMKALQPGEKTLSSIKSVAKGVFAIFDIGRMVLMGVVGLFAGLFGAVDGGGNAVLGFAGSVGDMVVAFRDFLAESGLVEAVFVSFGKILAVPLALLKGFAGFISGLFDGFNSGAAASVGDAVDGVGKRLGAITSVGKRLEAFFTGLGNFFGNIGSTIGNALMGIGDKIASMFTADTFGSTLDVINTTLLGGLVLMLRNFFSAGVNIDLSGGLFDGIKETLGEATSAFQTMQQNLKANILLKLAGAIAVMAAALMVLSMIDPASLTKALAAMSAGFAVLVTAMAALMVVMGPTGAVKIYILTGALGKLAFAILLLAFALKTLAGIKFGDMVRGLVGLAGMMYVLSKAMIPMAASSKGMAKAAFSMVIMGLALNILAVALKIFATMEWEEIARGLGAMTGTLLALAIGLKKMPPIEAEAVVLLALAVAITILAGALKIFATMSWEEMSKGILMLVGSLAAIALALRMMPKKTILLQALALNAVASAMLVLSGVLRVLGSMSWPSMAKGLIMLAGSLFILSSALFLMRNSLPGAAALLVASAALAILVPVIAALGMLPIGVIVTALVALVAVFTVLGVAGYLLAPVVPIIIGLAGALLMLGLGFMALGAGAFLAASAFALIVTAGMAGAQVLAGVLAAIVASIPGAMKAFAEGVVLFAVAIGEGAPQIALAFGKILIGLLDQVIEAAPKLAQAFLALLNAALKVIVTAIPRIVNAGLKLIVGFLGAISRHLPRIIDLAADIIVKFLNGIARNLGRIIQSGVDLILAFIRGVTEAINNNSAAMGEAGADLAIAIVQGMASGITAGAGQIKDALVGVAKDALGAAKDFLNINSPSKKVRDEIGKPIPEGAALGIKEGTPMVTGEIKKMGRTAIDKLGETMSAVGDAFALDPNLNPTITPVLDLGALTKEANKMGSILATAPIMPTVSYRAASDISTLHEPEPSGPNDGSEEKGTSGGPTSVTYEQHIHSPKPLDTVTIYRDSKSLFALAKEELSR